MNYLSASIANAFLNLSFRDAQAISPMKIQKLLYLAHGYSLAVFDEPLLNEQFQAWKFGPVVKSVYHVCKHFGGGEIDLFLSHGPLPEDSRANAIIDYVWTTYGEKAATALSKWTHEKGGPWHEARSHSGHIELNKKISDESIKAYFKRRMNE